MLQILLILFAIGFVVAFYKQLLVIGLVALIIYLAYKQNQKDNAKTKVIKRYKITDKAVNNHNYDDIEKEIQRTNKLIAEQDKQIAAVNKARDEYKKTGDILSYAAFWDGIFASGGLKFNGRTWKYEPIKVYILADRRDDAWRLLNKYALKEPTDTAIYNWRIKILKKDGRHQAAIEQVMHRFGYEMMYTGEINGEKFKRAMSPVCKKVSKDLQVAELQSIISASFRNGYYDFQKSRELLKEYFLDLGLLGKRKK